MTEDAGAAGGTRGRSKSADGAGPFHLHRALCSAVRAPERRGSPARAGTEPSQPQPLGFPRGLRVCRWQLHRTSFFWLPTSPTSRGMAGLARGRPLGSPHQPSAQQNWKAAAPFRHSDAPPQYRRKGTVVWTAAQIMYSQNARLFGNPRARLAWKVGRCRLPRRGAAEPCIAPRPVWIFRNPERAFPDKCVPGACASRVAGGTCSKSALPA